MSRHTSYWLQAIIALSLLVGPAFLPNFALA
jgi:hypothetical protein